MDASDMGMGTVLAQEPEEDKRVIAYASKTLNMSQGHYCTMGKELLEVIKAVELSKYYLTGHHLRVVTDHANLAWLRNFKEPEGVAAWRITWLKPFDFDIMYQPGKHHRHADGLSRRTPCPCKCDTSHKCATLLNQVTPEEE